jgi:two-component system sensor histidine kinase DcuS
MNKLHVILGLLNMKRYDTLEEYVLQTAEGYQNDIGTLQHQIQSPVVAGFLLGKINRAREAGIILTLANESLVPDNPNQQQVTALVTILGNLIENALDAMSRQSDGEIGLLLHYQNGWLSAEVSDDGPGIPGTYRCHIPQRLLNQRRKPWRRAVPRPPAVRKSRRQHYGGVGTWRIYSIFVQLPWDSERKSV